MGHAAPERPQVALVDCALVALAITFIVPFLKTAGRLVGLKQLILVENIQAYCFDLVVTVVQAFFFWGGGHSPPIWGGAGQGLATFSKGKWAKNKANFFSAPMLLKQKQGS